VSRSLGLFSAQENITKLSRKYHGTVMLPHAA
jgi:hypothetical protein